MSRARAQLIRINNLTGGEAGIFPYTAMPPKYSLLMQNCYVSESGTVKKAPGHAKVNTDGAAGVNLTSGFEFLTTAGVSHKLVAGGGKIFRSAGTSLTQLATGLDNGSVVNFSAMNDICIITNGVDAPQKYNGTSVSALSGTPPATAFKSHVHKGRVWMIERANKMLATHSSLNNPEEYTGGTSGYIDFKYILKKGDELLDMLTFIDLHVFIFRNHIAIYSGTTPSGTGVDYQLVQLIEGVGGVATNAAITLGSDLAVLHDSGVKSLRQIVTTGALNVGNLSDLISPVLRSEIIAAPAGYFSIAHYPRRSLLFILINDIIWVYSYQWKAWARITGSAAQYIFATKDGSIYFVGDDYVYLLDESLGTFDGDDVPMVWQTGWLPLSKSGNFIYPKILEFSVVSPTKPVTFTIAGYTDASLTATASSSATLLDDVADFDSLSPVDNDVVERLRVAMFGRGRQMTMKFSNTSSIPNIEISDLILQVVPGGF